MPELIHAHDWSRTPIGPRSQWPASLRTIVDVLITTQFPMALLWGRELILIYNDSYRVICGDKHPAALGRSTRDIWSEVWPINQPIFAAVMDRGETLFFEDKPFPINRRGHLEDAYFTLCYSPVRIEDGTIGGVLVVLEETTERKNSVEALRASEKKYRDLFENLNDAFVLVEPILDRNGRLVDLKYLRANPAVSRHLNKTPEELVGRLYSQVFRHHGRNPVFDIYEKVLSTGESYKGETLLPALNRHCDLAVYRPVPNRLALVLTDITERKAAEAALQQARDTLAEAQRIAHLGSFEYVAATRTTVWSEEEYRIYGLDPAGPSPAYDAMLLKYIHPDDAGLLHETFTKAMQDCSVYELEHRIVRPDGTVRWVYDRAHPYFDAQGRLARYIGTTLDITERKRTEEELRSHREDLAKLVQERTRELEAEIAERKQFEAALRESEERFQLFMDNSPTVVWIKDEQGRYVYLSKTCEDHFGIRLEDWRGKTDEELWPAETAEKFRRNDRAVLEAGHALDVEEETISPDGSRCYWLNCKFPFSDATGNLYVAGIGIDITTHKRAEALLQQAQKMETVGRLAGGMAHEFNNLLQGIVGYTELCRTQIAPDHPAGAHLNDIDVSAMRAVNLVRQLLAFARRQIVLPSVFDLNERVSAFLALLRRLIREDIELIWTPDAGPVTVKMDASQVDQILANLSANASDAIHGPGKITITTSATFVDASYCATHDDAVPGHYAMLVFSDTGCGMDEATRSRVFEPFFTTKEVGKGTGMGLATVYGIVKQNNGHVTVESAPGKGTTLRICLPLFAEQPVTATTHAASKPAPAASPSAPRQGSATILLVDDDPTVVRTVTALLDTLGYTVLSAASPEEALRLETEHSGAIDLLLTDVVMPGQNGRDLANQLMARQPKLKCIFMSGYPANHVARHGIVEQDVSFLAKPFNGEQLANKLREVLNRTAS